MHTDLNGPQQTTNETTWQNPFEAPAADPAPEASSSNGIDPELAYLDPATKTGSSSANPSYTARFNARTGRFEGDPTFDPSRVSEYSRGRKQASAYFDVDGWEKRYVSVSVRDDPSSNLPAPLVSKLRLDA